MNNMNNMNKDEMIVYCYKDYYKNFQDFYHKHNKIFERDKEYKCWIEKSENASMWVEYDPFGTSGNQGCRFYMENKRGLLSKFSNYFMTNRELRKLKLEKLYENK